MHVIIETKEMQMNISNLNQIIEKALNGLPLVEFALPDKKLIDRIEDRTEIIWIHLYKILAFGQNHPAMIHHWCAELGSWLVTVCNVLRNSDNKLLSSQKIFQTMLAVYSTLGEFSTIGASLYSAYGYSEISDDILYTQVQRVLIPLIEHVQSLQEAERPKPDKIEQIIKENLD